MAIANTRNKTFDNDPKQGAVLGKLEGQTINNENKGSQKRVGSEPEPQDKEKLILKIETGMACGPGGMC